MKISKLDYKDILIKVDFTGLEQLKPRTKWRDDFWLQWRINIRPILEGEVVFYIEHLREGDSPSDVSETLMERLITRQKKVDPYCFFHPVFKYKGYSLTHFSYLDETQTMVLFLKKISKSKIFIFQVNAIRTSYEEVLEFGKGIVDRVVSIEVKDENERL
jgi:hypothetical protein